MSNDPSKPIQIGTISALAAQLNSARIATTNNALYQTVLGLINSLQAVGQKANSNASSITVINTGGGLPDSGVIPGVYGSATEVVSLNINSKGIILSAADVPIATIGSSYVPMSTGAEPLEIMSDGAGQVLLIGYTP